MKTALSLLILFICSLPRAQTRPQTQVKPQPETQSHPPLAITHLTGDFYVYITWQPVDGTHYPANSMYLVTTKGVVLFDTPWDSTQFQPLLDSIEARHHIPVVMSISTHFHSDRTAGIGFLRQHGIATWSSAQTREFCALKGEPQAEYVFTKDTTFKIGNHSFRTFYPGEGHTKDNIVIMIATDGVLYGGCFIKSTETNSIGNLADANTDAWPASIKRLQRAFPHPKYVIPGHLGWEDSHAVEHTLDILARIPKSK